MPLSFRPATSADLAAVAVLVNSAYRGESSKRGWTTEADLLDGQRTDVEKLVEMLTAESRVELGFDADTLVACMYLRRQSPTTAYVGLLTVEPGLQANGLGKQLLHRAEELARDWNCRELRMTVIHLRRELVAYFERRGYALTGAWEPFPDEDPRYGIPKADKLHLLEMKKAL